MKLCARFCLLLGFVIVLAALAPRASADTQDLILGTTVIPVDSFSSTNSTFTVTIDGTDASGLDHIGAPPIDKLVFQLFATGSSVPELTVTLTDVTIAKVVESSNGTVTDTFTYKAIKTVETPPTTAPEPATFGLLALGVLACLAIAQKKTA